MNAQISCGNGATIGIPFAGCTLVNGKAALDLENTPSLTRDKLELILASSLTLLDMVSLNSTDSVPLFSMMVNKVFASVAAAAGDRHRHSTIALGNGASKELSSRQGEGKIQLHT